MAPLLKLCYLVLAGLVLQIPVDGQRLIERLLVYQIPEMQQVKVKKKQVYLEDEHTLHYDIYYPESYQKGQTLPVVIFANGITMTVPDWRFYQDWARLVATRGMIAIIYQARHNTAMQDNDALLQHLRTNATELGINKDRMGIWACSGHVPTAGFKLALQEEKNFFKCAVFYYGQMEEKVLRPELPILVVRCGKDEAELNESIQRFVQIGLSENRDITLINYPEGKHAFDLYNDNNTSEWIIRQTLDFLEFHLK